MQPIHHNILGKKDLGVNKKSDQKHQKHMHMHFSK